MSSNFKFDQRGLQKLVQEAGDQAVKDVIRKAQPILDRVFNQYKGQPVGVVKPHMRSALRQAGITPDNDAELTSFAQHVTDGTRIVFTQSNGRLSW